MTICQIWKNAALKRFLICVTKLQHNNAHYVYEPVISKCPISWASLCRFWNHYWLRYIGNKMNFHVNWARWHTLALGRNVRRYLNDWLFDKWIGRQCFFCWPACSKAKTRPAVKGLLRKFLSPVMEACVSRHCTSIINYIFVRSNLFFIIKSYNFDYPIRIPFYVAFWQKTCQTTKIFQSRYISSEYFTTICDRLHRK